MDGVTRETLAWLNLLRDGTATVVYTLSGDESLLEESLTASEDLCEYELFVPPGEEAALYCRFEPTPPVESLIAIHDRYPIVIDLPIPVSGDGTLALSVASTQAVAEEAFAAIPAAIEVELEHVGEYTPGRPDLLSYLTDRQREVLATAVEMGYYELPSRVTQDEIARECDCSAATVSTHLRKAEALLARGVVTGDR